MDKHFCTCTVLDCPANPKNYENGCDPCIKKNLKLGEIPACSFGGDVSEIKGKTEYSAEKSAKFVMEKQG